MSQSASTYTEDTPRFDVVFEARRFYDRMADAAFLNELKGMLPDSISVETFVRTAKTAVQTKPDLLNPDLRDSLLQGIVKAAQQGLLPDGRHGALIDRWDDRARKKLVVWQPMVHGIKQLGRRSGAFSEMIAHIVFEGEEIELLGGMENSIRHKIDPKIVDEAYKQSPDEFWNRVVLAYCIFVKPNGRMEWRYQTKARLLKVKKASRAEKGPWNGPFLDEMIRKSVIMFAAKDIDIDGESPDMQRLRAAIADGMEADFDQPALEAAPAPVSLPGGGLEAIAGRIAVRDATLSVGGKQQDQVGQISIGVVPPPPDSAELEAERAKRKLAVDFSGPIIRRVRQAILETATDEMAQRGAWLVLNSDVIQKNLAQLKLRHGDIYDSVLYECCNLRVLEAILKASEIAYPAFHKDLRAKAEEIADPSPRQVNVSS